MDSIERKKLLYRSGLGFMCVNHVKGCSHACRYPCYAYSMAHAHGQSADWADWAKPRLVANADVLLARELDKAKTKPESIHLCLTTDPFMYGWPEVGAMSLSLIAIANRAGVACSVLTKGELAPELSDRLRFPADNSHGISLVSLDEDFRARWEPGAAPFAKRIAALKVLHDAGRSTLVHIEPYPTPNIVAQDLTKILEAVGFVDRVFFGGWNYSALSAAFPDREGFYLAQAEIVRRFCAARGIACDLGKLA